MDTVYITDQSFAICNEEEIIGVQKIPLPTVFFSDYTQAVRNSTILTGNIFVCTYIIMDQYKVSFSI